MTDEQKTPEQLASKRLADAVRDTINGRKGTEVAIGAFAQAQMSQAALQGLLRLLVHKGVLSESELGDSMAWAYDERAVRIRDESEKGRSAIDTDTRILAPHARNSH